jgi:hypothetical protein
MADGGDNIFVYIGGEQEVPEDVTHVCIDRSVKNIPARAFYNRGSLVSVEMHDGIETVEKEAFYNCRSLRGIKLPGVKEVEYEAFKYCRALTDVEFGDMLETIGAYAFAGCHLRGSVTIPSARTIGYGAFGECEQLTEVELPVVEAFGQYAFIGCVNLQRIVIPLKDNMFLLNDRRQYNQFDECENLTTVDLVGGIHKTIASLLLESWRSEMNQEIDRINQMLPNTRGIGKTDAMGLWISSVTNRMEHYKAEHYRLLKEATTLLELALWKAKLDEKKGDDSNLKVSAKKAKVDVESMRKEKRTTSGADVIISNVLPFLQLE